MYGNMNNPLVSVIIPVYNVSPYIEECINSVISQTYTNLEVIIVNDSSTDDSIEKVYNIINSYDGEISFSVLNHEKNSGLSVARNTGLDAASGEYVSFIDSDDYIMPILFETLVSALLTEDESIAIMGCCFFSNKNINVEVYNDIKIIPPEEFAGEFLSAKTIGVAWAKLFQRHLFDFVRFREGRNGEDFLLMYDLYPIIEKMHLKTIILPNQLYYYRFRENSITTSKEKPYYNSMIRNLQEVFNGLKKEKHASVGVVEERYICYLYHCIVLLADNKSKKDYYRYCFKLWGVSNSSAKMKLPNKSDFKPFLLMKYLPFIYYYYRKIRVSH